MVVEKQGKRRSVNAHVIIFGSDTNYSITSFRIIVNFLLDYARYLQA